MLRVSEPEPHETSQKEPINQQVKAKAKNA